MQRQGASELLDVWETGLSRQPLDRALCLLWSAGAADPAQLPLASRDRALLDVRRHHLGDRLELVTSCEACGAELELSLDVADLMGAIPDAQEGEVEVAGHSLVLRPLTSADLAAAAQVPDQQIAEIIRARIVGTLPETVWPKVDAAIEAHAAEAELRLSLTCAECEADWSEPMDVAAHVWSEIDVLARRTLGEVAELARSYGWGEDQSLALSPQRRAAYLELARATS